MNTMSTFHQQLKSEFGSYYSDDENLPSNITIFDTSRPPTLTIDDYYDRFIKHSNCDKAVVEIMWVYLKRMVYNGDIHLNNYNIHRMVSQAFNLAMKFIDDDHIDEKLFCKIAGYNQKEYKQLEHSCLNLLQYNCMLGINLNSKEFFTS